MSASRVHGLTATVTLTAALLAAPASAQPNDGFRPFDDVAKGYTKVESAPGESPLMGLWVNKKEGQMLAELPRGWASKKFWFAATPASGVIFSGLQGPAIYCYWKRYDKRLALVTPELDVRSSGEKTSRDSVQRIFTDRVLLDVPIVALGPNKQPVIDLDDLLVDKGTAIGGLPLNGRLASVAKAKAFPQNIEVAVEAPDRTGSYKTMHYSISEIPQRTGYKPRVADDRIGYFLTDYRDLGQYGTDSNWQRYIHRWDIQKRDPALRLSPPKEPIIYYVEHTVPVRYRRFVQEGILQWNKAFEAIGIHNAIEVYQQDEVTGAHMDKDPEDVRYNFVRWLNNDIATAIGPSRANPMTGEILDADIILTDGWIRAFYGWWEGRPGEMMESLNAEALVWLEDFPQWDPRIQMLPPTERKSALAERRARAAAGDLDPADSRKNQVLASNPELQEMATWLGDECHHCLAAHGLAREMQFAAMNLELSGMLDRAAADPDDPMIDNVPESFVGPQLAHLVAHEVGHTLGLRHNFKASAVYSLDEVNSEEFKGSRTNAGSVMDYLPVNWNVDEDAVQGDFAMIDIGPYDMWAIEYGYTFGDTDDVLAKVGDRAHMFLTDDDTGGPDPLARRYDYSADPLEWSEDSMVLARENRERILTDYVDDGDSWERARRGYLVTLRQQQRTIDVAASWVGGTHVNRVKKGDPNTGDPLVPVDPDMQRRALDFVIENAFYDEAFGLTPELLNKMTREGFRNGSMGGESTWPVHDQVAAIQNMAVTMILNPMRLGRVYDNELRTPADQDAVTLPEVVGTMFEACYEELMSPAMATRYTNRQPMISSLRRSLQADMTDRLIVIATGNARVDQPIRQVALHHLRKLDEMLGDVMEKANGKSSIDTYSLAHLEDMHMRVRKALDAIYIAS